MSTSLYPFKLKDSVALVVLVCLNLSIYANAVLNEQLTAIVFSKAAQSQFFSKRNAYRKRRFFRLRIQCFGGFYFKIAKLIFSPTFSNILLLKPHYVISS